MENGLPLRVDLHLTRLATSVERLYGRTIPTDLGDGVRSTAHACGAQAALRVTATPQEDGDLRIATESRELPARSTPIELRPVTVRGGLGPHKLRDRRSIDELSAAPGTPLILDEDGAVLEAAWGNLFVLKEGGWATPDCDGRLLPGITRGALIGALERAGRQVALRRLALDQMLDADAILLTSALAPVTWAALPGWAGSRAFAADLAEQFARELLAA